GLQHRVGALETTELLFVARGAVRAGGKILDAHSALRVDQVDKDALIEVVEDTELFFIQMPKFPAAVKTAQAA
ncbi:MAG TPA: hypothetical protein VIX59_06310, partial [Candidatus Binataceae bacterium]